MLDELRELYQEVILDHGRNPRNHRHPEDANRHARGNNPICGDILVVYLDIGDDGVIRDAAFEGKGCAISIASASMMTGILKGKTMAQARALFENFHDMCTKDDFDPDAVVDDADDLDRLQVLAGVRAFPMRVKCATLAWHTMTAAMAGENEATTE
ncbi:MAG: SUF system NifU family Fe-S cluster assembly protein [Kiloniellales bacterium]